MDDNDVSKDPLKNIIRNCRRLIHDAELLLEHGSAGSALSLAIMAFEEAGKGQSHELSAKKTRRVRSHHQFRHIVASFYLVMSFWQKHGLPPRGISEKAATALKERLDKAKSFSEFAAEPPPEEFKADAAIALAEDFGRLPADQRTIAVVELQWLRKITMAAARGEVETLRQKGLYVDFDENGMLSCPSEIDDLTAHRWIWNAKRAVNLLAHGIFFQPYSILAAYLEAMPKPLPTGGELLKSLAELQAQEAKLVGQFESPAVDVDEPYPPFIRP